MTIKILKAGQGDSILISFGDVIGKRKHILVDGGNNKDDYESHLKQEVLEIQNASENISLLIITHTDQDHVKGIFNLLTDPDINKSIIERIWFNYFGESSQSYNNDISFRESCKVAEEIQKHNLHRINEICVDNNNYYDLEFCTLTIFSPIKDSINKLVKKNKSHDIASSSSDHSIALDDLVTQNSDIFIRGLEKSENSVENNPSIAFLLESGGNKILLLGDADPKLVYLNIKTYLKQKGIQKLELDYLKVSHHFSKFCTTMDLLSIINCNKFIVSANGKKDNLPNKLTFAKILKRKTKDKVMDKFLFNFKSVEGSLMFTDQEKERYNFSCFSENYCHGYKIEV